jgi:hypothetical protein
MPSPAVNHYSLKAATNYMSNAQATFHALLNVAYANGDGIGGAAYAALRDVTLPLFHKALEALCESIDYKIECELSGNLALPGRDISERLDKVSALVNIACTSMYIFDRRERYRESAITQIEIAANELSSLISYLNGK